MANDPGGLALDKVLALYHSQSFAKKGIPIYKYWMLLYKQHYFALHWLLYSHWQECLLCRVCHPIKWLNVKTRVKRLPQYSRISSPVACRHHKNMKSPNFILFVQIQKTKKLALFSLLAGKGTLIGWDIFNSSIGTERVFSPWFANSSLYYFGIFQ